MRKLRFRGMYLLAHGHAASKWQSWDSNLLLKQLFNEWVVERKLKEPPTENRCLSWVLGSLVRL